MAHNGPWRGDFLLILVGQFVIAGWLFAVPALAWCLVDLKRFHRHEWFGYGRRSSWHDAIVTAYLCGGWPALVVATAWRSSLARRAMLEQRSAK